MATFQYFGPFIFSFDQLQPNEVLMDYFLSMGQSNGKMQNIS